MSTSIVPHDPVQKAVALSFAELIRKKEIFKGDFPYAFCRQAFCQETIMFDRFCT